MKNFCFILSIGLFYFASSANASEAGMPQLNPEFWAAQVFWLMLIFLFLYLAIWKVFLPKITYSIESRKSKIVNDLDEAQKLKENAEKKLQEYNKIIESSKRQANKIIEDDRKKLNRDIEEKKQKISAEIENEVKKAEKEILQLKKNSISSIRQIAGETSSEVVKKLIDTDVNKSNTSAIIDEIVKRKIEKYL